MTAKDEVREASKQFYNALNRMANGNSGAMSDIWSHGPLVTALHPVGSRSVGWESVKESFAQVAQIASDGEIELKDQLVHVAGEVAYEVGVEHGQLKLAGQQVRIEHRVTNIYQREAGAWKMIHHHTDPSPAMLDVLGRLQPPGMA